MVKKPTVSADRVLSEETGEGDGHPQWASLDSSHTKAGCVNSERMSQGAAQARGLLQTGVQREALALCDAPLFCRPHLTVEDCLAAQVGLRQVEPINRE